MKAMLKAYAACVPSQVVDQLLVAGAEVGGADGQGRTPLHLAAIAGQDKVGAGCGGGALPSCVVHPHCCAGALLG